ncbi:MAG: hypothetical protein ACI4EF_08145, partial [Coprococcus sp.]
EGDKTGGKSSKVTGDISDGINEVMEAWGAKNDTVSEFSEALGGTSIEKIIDDAGASLIMNGLVKKELKNSKAGSDDELFEWLNIKSSPDVQAVISNKDGKDYLVAIVYYDVELIRLLNIDITFSFHNGVMTNLWTEE